MWLSSKKVLAIAVFLPERIGFPDLLRSKYARKCCRNHKLVVGCVLWGKGVLCVKILSRAGGNKLGHHGAGRRYVEEGDHDCTPLEVQVGLAM